MKRQTKISPIEQANRVSAMQSLSGAILSAMTGAPNHLGRALSSHLPDEWIASLYAHKDVTNARIQFEKCIQYAVSEMRDELYR